mmetsp:Transcript_14548/g.24205  ORF Transcript_14548/g.24205 Transcript_14548/m.24205 type:complete len:358 (-) Transcript_14548:155-1228(-)
MGALALASLCCAIQRGSLPLTVRRLAVSARARARAVAATSRAGDVASVSYSLKPDMASRAFKYGGNAEMLVDSLPFDIGDVQFVVGAGGYLPGLHSTVAKMNAGEKMEGVSIDAGAGEYREEGKVTVPAEQAPQGLKAGMSVMLSLGGGRQAQATVTELTEEICALDTNHPLAGVRMLMDVELKEVKAASAFEVATFAGGCFWGLELAYQREPGVVGTAVGYTQGSVESPTYEAVCSGSTGHTEAVQVIFDPAVVTYERLCKLLVERLENNIYLLNQVGNDRGTQYRHGIYTESDAQEATARAVLAAVSEHKSLGPVQTEVVSASKFWHAEDYHQQYLQKGGQSAKKEAVEKIRCYG